MALLLQSLSADLELLPNVIWRKPPEKPILHLSIILCISLPKLPSACDLARFGMAIGINLLFDIPLIEGVNYSFRYFFIVVLNQ
jgi:manganese transport protein